MKGRFYNLTKSEQTPRLYADPWQMLAEAVIVQAAEDYKKAAKDWHRAVKRLKKAGMSAPIEKREALILDVYFARDAIIALERFFNSQWCSDLIFSEYDIGADICKRLIKRWQTEELDREAKTRTPKNAYDGEALNFYETTNSRTKRNEKLKEENICK